MDEHRDLWMESPTKDLARVVQLPGEFIAQYEGRLDGIQVAYESWGSLNAARDNAVLIAHFITADCHATGEFAGQPPGWWEPLIGPGRALDTDRYFVVCPNLLGGCHGSTGPRFPAPDGAPYGTRFPLLTPRDLMRGQRLFLETLGVTRVPLVIGPSMGAMIAWEWVVEGGGYVDRVAVVAAPPATSPQQIGWNWLQRRALELDLGDTPVPRQFGQSLARGVGMITYRSPEGMQEKFGRSWFQEPGSTLADPGLFNVESWLRHHGKRSVKRFDPLTYDLLARAMDLHDIAAGRESLDAALGACHSEVLVVGVSSDQLYPASEVRAGAEALQRLGKRVQYAEIESPHGHDAFLLETGRLEESLRAFLPAGV